MSPNHEMNIFLYRTSFYSREDALLSIPMNLIESVKFNSRLVRPFEQKFIHDCINYSRSNTPTMSAIHK